jgi:ATP-binding cassette subfamily F protein 3
LLIGQLDPTKGQIKRHGRLRLAYFSQHHVEALETDAGVRTVSPLELFTSKYPGQTEEEYRGVLGRFGITGQTALQPIQTLSGGQKSRVVFAMMAMNNPHILVLDEVTNHLDIMTIDSLVKAINPKTGFKGGVIVVSHDARFIDRVCNELWICTGGRLSKFKPQKGVISGNEDAGEFAGTSGISEYKSQILRELETI